MIKFTNIQIGRVSNGWIVIGGPKPGAAANPDDTMLVKEDEDLAGAIAAALVAGKMQSDPPTENKTIAVPQGALMGSGPLFDTRTQMWQDPGPLPISSRHDLLEQQAKMQHAAFEQAKMQHAAFEQAIYEDRKAEAIRAANSAANRVANF